MSLARGCDSPVQMGSPAPAVLGAALEGMANRRAHDLREARITYVSDVEGHFDYFCRFVELSSALSFVTGSGVADAAGVAHMREAPELELADGWHFVYGGDSCDKGPGSIRFLQSLAMLKAKYPDRVHLILGNRDINKMRLTSELADSETGLDAVRHLPAAYWVPAAQRITALDYARRQAASLSGVDEESVTDEMLAEQCTKASKLKYMLASDMGSDGEFEFRRREIAHMQGLELDQVTDEQVVESYEEGLRPGGCMRQYLENAQLALVLRDTLFVHGQIIGNGFTHCGQDGVALAITRVPGVARAINDVHEWARCLNAWGRGEIDRWIEQPTWEVSPASPTRGAWSARGGSGLLDYGTPATCEPSVVYCRWLKEDSMPMVYPAELVDLLTRNGISRVVVGHTPHGNCPTVVPHDGVTLVMADTSFSQMASNLSFTGDNRGEAVAEVVIEGDDCRIHGRTECRQVIDYRISPSDVRRSDPLIGKVVVGDDENGFFVKAKLAPQPERYAREYLLCHVNGYKTQYKVLSLDAASSVSRSRCRTASSARRPRQLACQGERSEEIEIAMPTRQGPVHDAAAAKANGPLAVCRWTAAAWHMLRHLQQPSLADEGRRRWAGLCKRVLIDDTHLGASTSRVARALMRWGRIFLQ